MGSLLIAVIYLIFISLGLPDSLLGSGWPVMQKDFGVPSSYAGYVSMTISCMTILSALMGPFYPSILHMAPEYFGRRYSASDICSWRQGSASCPSVCFF